MVIKSLKCHHYFYTNVVPHAHNALRNKYKIITKLLIFLLKFNNTSKNI